MYIENGHLQILGYGTSEQAQILLQPIIASLNHKKKKQKKHGFCGLKTRFQAPPQPLIQNPVVLYMQHKSTHTIIIVVNYAKPST